MSFLLNLKVNYARLFTLVIIFKLRILASHKFIIYSEKKVRFKLH